MRLATTTGDITQHGYALEDAIRIICAAGFRHLDLSFYDIERKPEKRPGGMASPFMENGWEDYADRLRAYAESLGADFIQCHTPGYTNPFTKGSAGVRLREATERSIRASARLGIPRAVIHAGWEKGLSAEESCAKNRAFLEPLIPVLEETGVCLCVENSTRVNMGEFNYHFYTGETLAQFIDELNHPLIAACWDVGHAHLEGHNYPDLLALGERLGAVHIHGNSGGRDDHVLPLNGTLAVDEVMCGLWDSGFVSRGGVFTLETDCLLLPEAIYPAEHRTMSYGELPSSPAVPTESKLLADERLRYAAARRILEAYGIFED